MTRTRPEQVDTGGLIHSHQCSLPETTTRPARIGGFTWNECNDCGALKLSRTTKTKNNQTKETK